MIATTTWWPQAARLAVALANSGAYVGVICPDGSPLTTVSGVHEMFRYSAVRTRQSLATALQAMRPDLVVPCDERAVAHLHEIYRHELLGPKSTDDYLPRLVERSLGSPQGYDVTLDRGATLVLAGQEGIRVPVTRVLRSEADVRVWCAERPLSALLKADRSWGGAGVALVDSSGSALPAFRRMSRPVATWRAAKFLLSNRDPFPLTAWLRRERSGVIGQDFVCGQPANIMAACWQGEVVAMIAVRVLDTARQFGAATIIQPVTHDGMESAAKRLVRRLGLSGFCGLDFMIEDGTGEAHLIELNPRATQLGHLQLGAGCSLAAALVSRMRGDVPLPSGPPWIDKQTVAFFPQAWLSNSAASLLPLAHHDIPWEEPALVTELLRRPWERRSSLSHLADLLLRRPGPAVLLAEAFEDTRLPGLAE